MIHRYRRGKGERGEGKRRSKGSMYGRRRRAGGRGRTDGRVCVCAWSATNAAGWGGRGFFLPFFSFVPCAFRSVQARQSAGSSSRQVDGIARRRDAASRPRSTACERCRQPARRAARHGGPDQQQSQTAVPIPQLAPAPAPALAATAALAVAAAAAATTRNSQGANPGRGADS